MSFDLLFTFLPLFLSAYWVKVVHRPFINFSNTISPHTLQYPVDFHFPSRFTALIKPGFHICLSICVIVTILFIEN